MAPLLSIGDFSRMTQLTVKTLRHYHEAGLVVPERIDPDTGYRYYLPEQAATAAVVRRLRELDMPIAEVRAVLAGTPQQRNSLISAHLARLEAQLAATQNSVQSLRALLQGPPESAQIRHRTVPATPAWTISGTVVRDELVPWWEAAMSELRAALSAQQVTATGSPGALFSFEVFEQDRGEVTVFAPVDGGHPSGRIVRTVVPGADVVTLTHHGRHDDADLAYSDLGRYATAHEISLAGPLREYYHRFLWHTDDGNRWETELCWPVLRADA